MKITLVGNGIEKENITNFIKNNNIKNITIKNVLNQKKLKKEYVNSDIFILPSRYEPWGLSINEAMASENLIIASKFVGSANDLVKNNYNGFIFKNEKELSKILLYIVKNPKIINLFKKRSLKLIKKWDFKLCLYNLKKITN